MELYLCKRCGKKGTKEELFHHVCKGFEKHYDDDDDFLSAMLAVSTISSLGEPIDSIDIPDSAPEPSIEPGGDSGGGGCGGGD